MRQELDKLLDELAQAIHDAFEAKRSPARDPKVSEIRARVHALMRARERELEAKL
jgi:hypothetical protein